MLPQYADICLASLPRDGLAALGPIRAVQGVMVLVQSTRVWVRWEAGNEQVLRVILSAPDVALYAYRDGYWRRLGCHLPSFDIAAEHEFRPLHQILFPTPVQPLAPRDGCWQTIKLRLRPDDRTRNTSAMICRQQELLAWADGVPVSRLTVLQAATNRTNLLVLGPRLPLLPSSQRLWGETILKPLGQCLEPDLAESAVHECLDMADDELAIITKRGGDVFSRSVLRPVTRAMLRLASQETAP